MCCSWVMYLLSYLHTQTRLMALCPGLPVWAGTRKVKPIWILLKQVTLSGSGISWAICKSAPHSRQITMPAPHHSTFYRPGALPASQPAASKHWRQTLLSYIYENSVGWMKDERGLESTAAAAVPAAEKTSTIPPRTHDSVTRSQVRSLLTGFEQSFFHSNTRDLCTICLICSC